jgi:hypothetical protein
VLWGWPARAASAAAAWEEIMGFGLRDAGAFGTTDRMPGIATPVQRRRAAISGRKAACLRRMGRYADLPRSRQPSVSALRAADP